MSARQVKILETNNGYIITLENFGKAKGHYVFKATEILTMLEFVGEQIHGSKVKVERQ